MYRFVSRAPLVVGATLGALALIIAFAANAFASIPDNANVYHGCVQSSNLPIPGQGTLRLIDTAKGQSCTRYETPVSWNAAGDTGPTGPQGATGATGVAGTAGTAGV